MSYNPNTFPKFKTMDEMMEHFYPDSESIEKADAPLLSTTTGWWNTIFGKKVWAQLNYEANAFAILPKMPWTQTGWRVESAYPVAAASWPTGGVAENSAPTSTDSIKPTWLEIETDPKTVFHMFDTSEVAEFLAGVDDSIDAISILRQRTGEFHVEQINEMLCTDSDTLAGDNIESLDRVISSYDEITNCGMTAGDSDIYGIDRDAAASWADAVVNENANVDRELTLSIIDETLKDIWSNGGKPNVILTGYDTLMEWQSLLEAQRRFMPSMTVVPSFAGVQGAAPGVEAGFMVSTYHGIPIIPTHRMNADGISRIYLMDTNYLYLRIAKPTEYMESRKILELDRFGMRGAYRTMAELICTRFNVHGKIRDLKAA